MSSHYEVVHVSGNAKTLTKFLSFAEARQAVLAGQTTITNDFGGNVDLQTKLTASTDGDIDVYALDTLALFALHVPNTADYHFGAREYDDLAFGDWFSLMPRLHRVYKVHYWATADSTVASMFEVFVTDRIYPLAANELDQDTYMRYMLRAHVTLYFAGLPDNDTRWSLQLQRPLQQDTYPELVMTSEGVRTHYMRTRSISKPSTEFPLQLACSDARTTVENVRQIAGIKCTSKWLGLGTDCPDEYIPIGLAMALSRPTDQLLRIPDAPLSLEILLHLLADNSALLPTMMSNTFASDGISVLDKYGALMQLHCVCRLVRQANINVVAKAGEIVNKQTIETLISKLAAIGIDVAANNNVTNLLTQLYAEALIQVQVPTFSAVDEFPMESSGDLPAVLLVLSESGGLYEHAYGGLYALKSVCGGSSYSSRLDTGRFVSFGTSNANTVLTYCLAGDRDPCGVFQITSGGYVDTDPVTRFKVMAAMGLPANNETGMPSGEVSRFVANLMKHHRAQHKEMEQSRKRMTLLPTKKRSTGSVRASAITENGTLDSADSPQNNLSFATPRAQGEYVSVSETPFVTPRTTPRAQGEYVLVSGTPFATPQAQDEYVDVSAYSTDYVEM